MGDSEKLTQIEQRLAKLEETVEKLSMAINTLHQDQDEAKIDELLSKAQKENVDILSALKEEGILW